MPGKDLVTAKGARGPDFGEFSFVGMGIGVDIAPVLLGKVARGEGCPGS